MTVPFADQRNEADGNQHESCDEMEDQQLNGQQPRDHRETAQDLKEVGHQRRISPDTLWRGIEHDTLRPRCSCTFTPGL